MTRLLAFLVALPWLYRPAPACRRLPADWMPIVPGRGRS